MDNMKVKIEGEAELNRKLKDINKSLGNSGDLMREQAEGMANEIRSRAPGGPTGNLKRSVIAKMSSHSTPGKPYALAAIDRKIAPHAFIVEYGSSRAPAHPFFRPAVEAYAQKAHENMKKGLQGIIKKVAKRAY